MTRTYRRLLPLLLAASLALPSIGSAQRAWRADPYTRDNAADHAFYLELLGNGLLMTLNYELILEGIIPLRVGILCLPGTPCPISMPITAGYLLGSGSHRLEVAAGMLWIYEETFNFRGHFVGGTMTLGWRYQPWEGGFLLRSTITPIFDFGPQERDFPFWLGFSAGWAL